MAKKLAPERCQRRKRRTGVVRGRGMTRSEEGERDAEKKLQEDKVVRED